MSKYRDFSKFTMGQQHKAGSLDLIIPPKPRPTSADGKLGREKLRRSRVERSRVERSRVERSRMYEHVIKNCMTNCMRNNMRNCMKNCMSNCMRNCMREELYEGGIV